jgi:hypothetical protein
MNDWRRQLGRGIGWTLLVKLIALVILWALFFSPANRTDVTAGHVESRLVIEATPETTDD